MMANKKLITSWQLSSYLPTFLCRNMEMGTKYIRSGIKYTDSVKFIPDLI